MKNNLIINGIKWTSIQFAFAFLLSFIVKLVLAKLLVPTDFGLVGMASVIIAVGSSAAELGMSAALIQKKDNDEAEKLYDTAFWTGVLWGIILYAIICFIISPIAAHFFNEQILEKLIPILSVGILIRPLNTVHISILTRSLDFKKIAIINNIATLIAGIIGIITAIMGLGVWSLAFNSFFMAVLTVPLFFVYTKWLPKLKWEKKYFLRIFSFGAYSTGTSVFSMLTYNIDNLFVGKLLGSFSLGSYSLAFTLTEKLRQTISSVVNKVMYPVFGKYQNNPQKMKRYFLKIVYINSIAIYPIMAIFFIFSKNIILFFGDKWLDAVTPLRILAIAMMIHLIINSFSSFLRGIGFPKLEFKIIFIQTIFIFIPCLIVGILNWGIVGAAYAILINKVTLVCIATYYLNKHLGLTIIEIIESLKSSITSIIIAGIVIFVFQNLFNVNSILFLIPVFISIYIVALIILEKEPLRLIVKQII